jgi:hypothetical protein
MAEDEAGTPRRLRRSYPSNGATAKPKATQRTRAARPPVATPVAVRQVAAPVMVPTVATPSVAEDGTSLKAERVDLRGSAVGRVEASDLSVALGAVGAARADRISIDKGALGAAMANEIEVSRGFARSILARNVQLDRAAARVVVAADVNATRTAVMFLVARRVSGDVKVLFDWRGALAFGAVAGIIGGLLARARRSGDSR